MAEEILYKICPNSGIGTVHADGLTLLNTMVAKYMCGGMTWKETIYVLKIQHVKN